MVSVQADEPAELDALVERARVVLGDVFATIDSVHRRAGSFSTPPRNPHRLAELVDVARRRSAALRAGTFPSVDFAVIGELLQSVSLLENYSPHEAWPQLLASLKNPTDYPHAIIQLSAADHFGEHHNFRLGTSGRTREPDLVCFADRGVELGIEVKVPVALQRRSQQIGLLDAKTTVAKALKEAGTGVGDQLGPERVGILVVGAFHPVAPELQRLHEAALTCLERSPDTKRHILGIQICALGVVPHPDHVGVNDAPAAEFVNATYRDLVLNPNYSGRIRLKSLRVWPPGSALEKMATVALPRLGRHP